MKKSLAASKTIGWAFAQILATWAFYFISDEISLKIAVGYTLFGLAQGVNRYFTKEPLELPFRKK